MSGSCAGPSLMELARKLWRSARSYWNSISLRTTRSSFGMRLSAAVAARSAGCSYALGEMSTRRWRITASPATKPLSGEPERRAEERAGRSRIHRGDDADREPVPAGGEPLRWEDHAQGLAADSAAARGERGRVLRQLLEARAVRGVDVAAQAEAEARVPNRRAVELPADCELEARAAGDDAALRSLVGRPDLGEIGLRCPVGVEEAGLPAVEVGLVDAVEEVQAAHVRLAEREGDRLRVVRALGRRVDGLRRRRLAAAVEALLRDRDLRLDAVLVVHDRKRRAQLRGAVERAAEDRHELPVVAEPDRGRVRVLEARRLARVVAVRVEGELVHDRLGATARAVGGAHVGDEGGGRVRVPPGVRPVDAAGGDGAAEDGDRRRHGLQGVVRLREE